MEDKKSASNTELKLEKKNVKVKKEWTIKRVLTTVIIAILAMLMVGGSFYYIFSPGFSKSSNAFGFYDGDPILYENNSIFARTLMADENYQNAYTSGDYSTVYSSWYKAYQTQVAFNALSKMADKAGIKAPQKLVNKLIINSGAFNNEDGEFDVDKYNETSDADKRYFYTYMKKYYPFQIVSNDVSTALTSEFETSFISAIGSNARTFDYFVVGANAYPDYLTKSYVENNKDMFKLVDVSMISCSSEENANECIKELNSGLSWDDAVVKYSQDTYSSSNGYVGYTTFAAVFATNMKDSSNVSQLVSLKSGEYSSPIEGPYAWVIYKLNKDVEDANLADASVLTQVKQAIYTMDSEVMKEYIEKEVASVTEEVSTDFDAVAEQYGKVSVGPAVNNAGSSEILYGIAQFDSNGILAEAIEADASLNTTLFKESVGYVAGPIEVEEGYLFVKVAEASMENSLGQTTKAMYSYYANQFDVIDLENSVISSDKHTDNFTSKFLSMFFGSTN